MNMKEIEALITVMRNKSFSEAALVLNFSPSVISKYISKLEKELGIVLFSRSNRASSITLTEDGEALMPNIIQLYESYQRLQNSAAALRDKARGFMRIGTGIHRCTPGRDEIIADFILKHPDIPMEQIKLDFDSQIHAIYSGKLDGAFVMVQKDSVNSETLDGLRSDPKIESYLLVRNYNMYLAISEKEPLAAADAVPFTAFQDFSIAFHPNHDILVRSGTMTPFLQLSKKYGMELKHISIDTNDTSTFHLTKHMKIAIPSASDEGSYPGVKFVRVLDWDAYSTSYFLALRSNRNRALTEFKKSVLAYLSQAPTA
jgi:DNA-binding transcriptional LysR family regulator